MASLCACVFLIRGKTANSQHWNKSISQENIQKKVSRDSPTETNLTKPKKDFFFYVTNNVKKCQKSFVFQMTSLPVWPFVLGCKGENSVKTLLLLPHLTTEQMTQHWVRPDFYKHVLFWILYTFQLEKGGVGRHGWCHFVKEFKYFPISACI